MFYGQCWKCGERWELGTASACKCPEETTIDWTTAALPLGKISAFSIGDIKPTYNMTFHRDGKQIGVLDFNGPEMTFSGDMDESAKVFFDWIAQSFKGRLEQERADERNSWPAEMEAMERQVNILTDALAQAKADEREACAKVCDDLSAHYWAKDDAIESVNCEECATAIRARSNT